MERMEEGGNKTTGLERGNREGRARRDRRENGRGVF